MSSRIGVPNLAGWREERLVDLCELISRGTAPVYVDESPVLAIGQRCIRETGFDANSARPHSHKVKNVLKAKHGDVLLNSTGTGTIGRSCIFNEDREYMVDGHVTVLRADRSKVDPRWIEAMLRSRWGQQHLESHCFTGSTNQVELSRSDLLKTSVPAPGLDEQRRIVEILDAVEARIDLASVEHGKVKACAEALAQSLIPVDPDPRVLGDGWDLLALSEVVPSVEYGISSSLELGVEGIPTLRMNNLEGGKMRLHEVKASVEAVPLDLLLRDRDVLFNRTNSLEHVGRTSLWRSEIPVATFASYLVRLNSDHRRLCPEYLVRWLNRPAVQQRIRRFATPGVHQVNINPTSLRRTLIELPIDVRRQQQIVAELDSIDALASSLQSEHRRLLEFKQGLMEDLLSGRVRV
ncbi:restriction endonuclease subunit S [Streptomyces sp. NPDC059340]|uniref:restriction endonuclease subunit S n=1 Tax=Streptomyces sp. NPDC059340 TaxID=3346806 RepID=UPI0036AC679F